MIITKTPLRISFTGGGTDIKDFYGRHGGAVVSTGINKYIYISVNPKFDNKLRVSYSKTETVDEVSELRHDLVRECLHMVGIRGGVEITSTADIPAGTGLGSSSAYTVGVLNALYTYIGERLSAEELASRACEIEIDILKHPIGKQDQYAAAYGGINYFQFAKDGTVYRKRIFLEDTDIRLMKQKLMLFYTGITRSADEVLAEQKKNIDKNVETLAAMKDQAQIMRQKLENESFGGWFGELLHEGWRLKKDVNGMVSDGKIDKFYQEALEAGAIGGKLLGAGGGGFLLFYCDEKFQSAVETAVGLRRIDFHPNLHGSQVVFFS